MPLQLIATSDGSNTFYSPRFKEIYHSLHGARQEAEHIYIRAGLAAKCLAQPSQINLLEMGLGTGLNALLTYLATAHMVNLRINYTALEKYPLVRSEVTQLNYVALLGEVVSAPIFEAIHQCVWGSEQQLGSHFFLQKKEVDLQTVILPACFFDVVYFDAFGPEAQPELWTIEIFRKLFQAMAPGGILVTYCAKGQVRRNLKEAGFRVEKLPGPPGKREITRAWVG